MNHTRPCGCVMHVIDCNTCTVLARTIHIIANNQCYQPNCCTESLKCCFAIRFAIFSGTPSDCRCTCVASGTMSGDWLVPIDTLSAGWFVPIDTLLAGWFVFFDKLTAGWSVAFERGWCASAFVAALRRRRPQR